MVKANIKGLVDSTQASLEKSSFFKFVKAAGASSEIIPKGGGRGEQFRGGRGRGRGYH